MYFILLILISLDGIELNHPRLQVLQKIGNLCILLENILTESRRQTSELMKEILSESTIELLFDIYKCTIPPSKQLYAQISIRNNITLPHFGHSHSAKAIR